ncbi:hypothetical protein FKM82_016659 [Ascaphus truei]
MRDMQPPWVLLAVALCMAPMFLGEDILCYESGNCYMLYSQSLNFSAALTACGSKGFLATMKDEQEEREIMQFLRQFQDKLALGVFWIGLSKQPKSCAVKQSKLYGFNWVTGGDNSTVSYWAEPPKKSCTSKRCVGLQSGSGPLSPGPGNRTWGWKDHRCSKRFASICRSHAPWKFSNLQGAGYETILHLFTDHYTYMFFPEESEVTILCGGFGGNITLTCGVVNGSHTCMNSQCTCVEVDGKGRGSESRRCREHEQVSCLQLCLNPYSNVSCTCTAGHNPCDSTGTECPFTISISPPLQTPNSTVKYDLGLTTGVSEYGEESLFDSLFIPLILGLVALGMLAMLVWGGIHMCLIRRKPRRKKSIVPTNEPEGSETDFTDRSSSDEDEEVEDGTEIP